MSLPIKKVYLDSRYKRFDSASNSNCKFELKQPIHLPLKCVAYIDDIQIPHTWYNVTDTNNNLYIRSLDPSNVQNDHLITIVPKNYTLALLASDLNTKLNAVFNGNLNCTVNERRGTISFVNATGYKHRIYSDEELQYGENGFAFNDVFNGPGFNWTAPENGGVINGTNPLTMNDVMKITGATEFSQAGGTVETGFINLRSIHNIYITSPNLGAFDTLGPRGEQNIVKKYQ